MTLVPVAYIIRGSFFLSIIVQLLSSRRPTPPEAMSYETPAAVIDALAEFDQLARTAVETESVPDFMKETGDKIVRPHNYVFVHR